MIGIFMIEVQLLNNEKLFNQLKKNAIYYSDRTKVLSLDDSFKSKIPSSVQVFQYKDPSAVDKYVIGFNIDKGQFTFSGLTDSMRVFLDMWGLYSKTIDLRGIEKIYYLAKSKEVKFTSTFRSRFYPISMNSGNKKISDLMVAAYQYGRPKKDYFDVLGVPLKDYFAGMALQKTPVKVLDCQIHSSIETVTSKGRPHIDVLANYYNSNKILQDLSFSVYTNISNVKKVAIPGSKAKILVDDKGNFITFLPNDITMDIKQINVASPGRDAKREYKIKVEMFRMAYFECLLRGYFHE